MEKKSVELNVRKSVSARAEWHAKIKQELEELRREISTEVDRHLEAVKKKSIAKREQPSRNQTDPKARREEELNQHHPRKQQLLRGKEEEQEEQDGEDDGERIHPLQDDQNVALENQGKTELTQDIAALSAALSEATQNQSFLLRATFELVKTKLDFEAQVLGSLRSRIPGLPTICETIMHGQLRKGKDSKTKFVLVSPGMMTVLTANTALGSSACVDSFTVSPAPTLYVSTKSNRERKDNWVSKIPLCPGTICKSIDKKNGKYAFEVHTVSSRAYGDTASPSSSKSHQSPRESEDAHTRFLWVASTEEERANWIRVIEYAANLAPGLRSTWRSWDRLDGIRDQIVSAQDEEKYLRTLGSCFGLEGLYSRVCLLRRTEHKTSEPFLEDASAMERVHGLTTIDIPVEWVQDRLGLSRQSGMGPDSSTEQILKDMQRDEVVINGKLFSGWAAGDNDLQLNSSSGGFAGPGVCSIVCALAQEIRNQSSGVYLSEAEALALGHQVLASCNRTHSGGSTFEAVQLLCAHEQFGMVVFDSEDVQPLKLTVYRPGTGNNNNASSGKSATENVTESEPTMDVSSFKSLSPPLTQGRKRIRGKHRKTASEGEALANRLENLDLAALSSTGDMDWENEDEDEDEEEEENAQDKTKDESFDGHGIYGEDDEVQTCHSANRSQASNSRRNIQGEILRSFSKMRHRRRASEPHAKLPHELTGSLINGSETKLQEFTVRDPGPRVDVQVLMNYKICNPNFESEVDAVWARITAVYKRTFALVGQRKTVALGQGVVSLSAKT